MQLVTKTETVVMDMRFVLKSVLGRIRKCDPRTAAKNEPVAGYLVMPDGTELPLYKLPNTE